MSEEELKLLDNVFYLAMGEAYSGDVEKIGKLQGKIKYKLGSIEKAIEYIKCVGEMDKEKLLKIINTYGVLPQLKYFQSEVFELNEAIISYENFLKIYHNYSEPDIFYANQDLKMHIAEEIADVMVMLEQFKLYYGISSEDITKIFWEKVDRQISRIEKSDK